jgi:NitT/TauT family transport system substrate-binding protein
MRAVEGRAGRRATAVVVAALLAVAVLALAACGGDDSSSSGGSSGGNSSSSGSGPEKTSLKVGILKISDVYPLWVAQKEGFFKDVGIDNVQATEMAGGAAIQPAIQSGQLDLGWSNVVSVVIAKPQGFSFKFIGGGTWIGPGAERNQVVLVKKDSPIKSPKDLVGKRYGVNTLGNIAEVSVRSWLDHNGVDPNKVKIVELGTPITVPPLVQGRVDAVSANEPAVTIGLQTGKVRILAENPYKGLGKEVFLAGWIANQKFLEQNPKTVKAFNEAISKAVAWTRDPANKDAFNQLLAQNTGLAPDVVSKQVMSITKDQVTATDIQPWIDATKKYGLLKETFPPEDVLWQGSGK